MANRLSEGTVAATTGVITGGIEVDPISRIEGHLGVQLATDANGFVSEANVHGNLWRGFENFLLGRSVNDAITFTQRICGVCPVPHGLTSTYAVDHALGYSEGHITFAYDGTYGIPKKAVHIRNLVLGAETLMSSITHFYHLVALDYVQGPALPPWTPFFNENFYHALLKNPGGQVALTAALGPRLVEGYSKGIWDAAITQYVKALRIRRLTFEAGALFAGRMPMTSCFVGGGVTNDGTEDLSVKCAKFKDIMKEIGVFVIKEYVPLVLALGALYPNYDNKANADVLFGLLPALWTLGDVEHTAVAPTTTNTGWGAGVGNFLAWGAFPNPDTNGLALYGGVYSGGASGSMLFPPVTNKAQVKSTFLGTGANSVAVNLKESIAYSHYAISEFDTANINATTKLAYPGAVQRTKPNRANGYSYIKAPRWGSLPCEVGPLARMVVRGLYDVKQTQALKVGFGTYYTIYAKTATTLDPAMIHADLGVALLRDGLVTLTDGATTYYASKTSSGVSTAGWLTPGVGWVDVQCFDPVTQVSQNTLETAYSTGTVTIGGPVAAWVLNIVGGLSVMDRLRGRALESLFLVQNMIGTYAKGGAGQARGAVDNGSWGTGWIDALDAITDNTIGSTWRDKVPAVSATGAYGATEAPRGALAHFVSTNEEGKITAYQCVVPTTWNASPRDINGASARGPMEQAMMYIPYRVATKNIPSQDPTANPAGITTQGGVEALRVAHTFDPCIACAIH